MTGRPRPHGDSGPSRSGGTTVRPAGTVSEVHESSAQALQDNRPGGGGFRALPPGRTPRALNPGTTSRTLDDIRAERSGPGRGAVGEQYGRELYGGGPERRFPVTPNDDPEFPVTTPGGRKVDVPVDLPNGGTLAVEIKHYRDWKWVKFPGGGGESVPNEVPLNSLIREQIAKDVALREADPTYDPRWVFLQSGPDPDLRKHLTDAGIIFVEHGP